ncbi:MAG: ABC transporter ATP-binding protein, partial [Candidatus Poribacteria bacterium]
LALARGLMLNPKLLLLDEPSLGLAPNLVEEVFEAIAKIAYEMGVSILLVEQNTLKALEVSTRTYLLENGQVMVSGNSLELSKSQDLQRIFLGG